MSTFPYYSKAELKSKCPSRAGGRTWTQELAYRTECIAIITACCNSLRLQNFTLEKAVVLLHRYFTRCSSLECTGLDKWAVATACVFLASKMDSSYHRLESVAHSAFVELRRFQKRPCEPEYFKPDGSPGNPAFIADLAGRVRRAEMDLLFAINFDFNISSPSYVAFQQMQELGLNDQAQADPQTGAKVALVRLRAVGCTRNSMRGKSSIHCLMFPAASMALGAICKACRAAGLEWSLVPRVPDPPPRVRMASRVPSLSPQELAEVMGLLPAVSGSAGPTSSTGTRPTTPGDSSAMDVDDTGGCAQAGGRASDAQGGGSASATATNTALHGQHTPQQNGGAAAQQAVVRHEAAKAPALAPARADSSACDATTARVGGPSPISPGSENGPAGVAQARPHAGAGGQARSDGGGASGSAGGSAGGRPGSSRRVSFASDLTGHKRAREDEQAGACSMVIA